MTGFIRGLFGGKKEPRQPQQPQQKGAFFLDADDAKSLGDIEFMRSSKVIKRTFARKKGQTEELESIRKVSAMDKVELREDGRPVNPTPAAPSAPTPSTPATPEKFQRRTASTDTNMDMFRNMAKDLRK